MGPVHVTEFSGPAGLCKKKKRLIHTLEDVSRGHQCKTVADLGNRATARVRSMLSLFYPHRHFQCRLHSIWSDQKSSTDLPTLKGE